MFGLQGFRKNYMDPHVLSVIANPDPVVDKKTFQNNLFLGFDSQPPLVQDLSVLKMKNPFKILNEKKGSCVAIFGKTKVSSIESTERLLECGGGQKFFWMESWWSPVDRLGGWWRKWGRCGRVLVPSPVDGVQWGSLPPSCSNTHHPPGQLAVPQFNCTFVHIWHNLDFM